MAIVICDNHVVFLNSAVFQGAIEDKFVIAGPIVIFTVTMPFCGQEPFARKTQRKPISDVDGIFDEIVHFGNVHEIEQWRWRRGPFGRCRTGAAAAHFGFRKYAANEQSYPYHDYARLCSFVIRADNVTTTVCVRCEAGPAAEWMDRRQDDADVRGGEIRCRSRVVDAGAGVGSRGQLGAGGGGGLGRIPAAANVGQRRNDGLDRRDVRERAYVDADVSIAGVLLRAGDDDVQTEQRTGGTGEHADGNQSDFEFVNKEGC